MRGREQGQIIPILAGVLLSALLVGFLLFLVARAGVLRSEGQTAADAAALAGVRNAKQQLEAMQAGGGVASVALIQDPLVIAAAAEYARKNDAVLVNYFRQGVDVKVWVKTRDSLGEEATRRLSTDTRTVNGSDLKGSARARARIELTSSPVQGFAGGSGSGGGGSSDVPSGDKRISDADWERFKKEELGNQKPTCEDNSSSNDVIKLGKFLQSQGFRIGENDAFSGPSYGIGRSSTSWHYRCGEAGAIDVNTASGASPGEMADLDPLIQPLKELGFATIWRAPGHWDHLHIDVGRFSQVGPGGGLGFGFGDQVMEIRLIDWESAYEDFNPYPSDGTQVATAGNPDPRVMQIMCSALDEVKASPRVRLATFETAIVESGVRNLNYGDRDSVGVFQQRANWGPVSERTNVRLATLNFLNGNDFNTNTAGALDFDKNWSRSTGALAQAVQVSAFPERYDQVAGQAASLHNKYCGGDKVSPSS